MSGASRADRDTLREMGLLRSSCPTVCPVCDSKLESVADLAAEPNGPRCPTCTHPLVAVKVAGLWRRAAAGTLDALILLVTAGALNGLLLMWIDPAPLLGEARGLDALLTLLDVEPASVARRYAPSLLMAAIYLGLFWSITGQTPGQRLLRVRVVDVHGVPPHPVWAAVRVLGHALGLAAGAMGWLWVAFDREKRGLHDHLARTYVVKES